MTRFSLQSKLNTGELKNIPTPQHFHFEVKQDISVNSF